MSDITPTKLKKNEKLTVEDANINDERIPRNLILMYGETPYIQKAGLEWKANQLFGGAGFSLELEPHTIDYEKKVFIFKATLTVAANGQRFVNFGEATPSNTNSRMQGQLLHLAATRAECRVLRMATATGYASYDEVMTMPHITEAVESKHTPTETASKVATAQQIETIKSLVKTPEEKAAVDEVNYTFSQAADRIKELTKKK